MAVELKIKIYHWKFSVLCLKGTTCWTRRIECGWNPCYTVSFSSPCKQTESLLHPIKKKPQTYIWVETARRQQGKKVLFCHPGGRYYDTMMLRGNCVYS